MFKWIKNRINLLKNDKDLAKLLFCHLLLIVLHVCEYYTTDIQYFWYLRAGGCALISVLIFFIGRQGLAYGLFIYGCTLVYVNNFYNYATIFFIYIAAGANPKLKKVAPWIYIANVAIAFKLKNLDIIAFCIHCIYTVMFGIKINYVFIPNKPETLNLTEDEKFILSELAKNKLQKQIEGYHQNTITKYIKNAMDRNMCKTKAELLHKYMESLPQDESQDESQDQDD